MKARPKTAVDPSQLSFKRRTTGARRFAAFCRQYVVVRRGKGALKPLWLRPCQVELVGTVLDPDPRPRPSVRLEGPFQVRSEVTMKPKGQEPITSLIVGRPRTTAEGQRLAQRAITAVEQADAQFFGTEADALTTLLQRMIGPGLPLDRATAPAGGRVQDSSR